MGFTPLCYFQSWFSELKGKLFFWCWATGHWLPSNRTWKSGSIVSCVVMCCWGGWVCCLWWCCREPLTGCTLTHLSLDKMAAILPDDNCKCVFLNENERIPIRLPLKFVLMSPIDNKPALVQVMAWRWTSDKALPELLLTQFTDAYMRHQGEMS